MRDVDQLVVEPVSILQVNSLSCGGKKKYDNEFCIFCIGGNHIRCKKFTIIYRSYSVNSIKPLYTSFAFVKQKRMKKKEREMRERESSIRDNDEQDDEVTKNPRDE